MTFWRPISVLGDKTNNWDDPRHSEHFALERRMGELDNCRCDICGAVGYECNRHAKPKPQKRTKITVGHITYIH